MTLFTTAILALIGLRLCELALAKKNTERLLALGAREVGREHYKFIVALHVLFFTGMICEALWRQPAFHPRLGALFLLILVARVWVIISLGPRWTTRVIVDNSEPLVTTGPYRYLRHPNYLVVALEIAVFPSTFGLWYSAVIFSLLNALLLGLIRIPIEDAAIRGADSLARGNNHGEIDVTNGSQTTL